MFLKPQYGKSQMIDRAMNAMRYILGLPWVHSLIIIVVIGASAASGQTATPFADAFAQDYDILAIDGCARKTETSRPGGELIIDGGVDRGVEPGMFGFVLGVDDHGDTLRVAEVRVFLTKWDLSTLWIVQIGNLPVLRDYLVRLDEAGRPVESLMGDKMLLKLSAARNSWATVIADGDTAIHRVLMVGNIYSCEAAARFTISVGMPGAVTIELDSQVLDLTDPKTGRISRVCIDRFTAGKYVQSGR